MKKAIVLATILILVLTACGTSNTRNFTGGGLRGTETALAESGNGFRTRPTETPLPSNTPLPPTVTPSSTPTPAPTLDLFPEVTISIDTNCRLGPAKAYYSVYVFNAGQTTQVNGRTEAGDWISVQNPEKLDYCWVIASSIKEPIAIEPLILVPVKALPEIPWGFTLEKQVCQGLISFHFEWSTDMSASGYRLYRNGALIGEFGGSTNSYIDYPPARKSYTYAIQATNDVGVSKSVSLAVPNCP
jgi:hypothetical protein